jgi:hypothetical protein
MRLSLNGNRQHLFGDCHFQIHARIQRLAQNAHVTVGDMATVFTQVYGNTVRARLFNDKRRLNRVRICGTACIT